MAHGKVTVVEILELDIGGAVVIVQKHRETTTSPTTQRRVGDAMAALKDKDWVSSMQQLEEV